MPHAALPHALTLAGPEAKPERAAVLENLRRLLPQLENVGRGSQILPFGLPQLDRALPHGGLALDALHEIVPETAADMGAALGFMSALLQGTNHEQLILVVQHHADLTVRGQLHGHGLSAFGLDPTRLVLAQAGSDIEALWAMEEALRSGAPAAVAGLFSSLGGLDLKASRRLHLAAAQAGLPLFLLLPGPGASAAVTRWRIGAAPAVHDRFGLLDRWRWRVELERCRNGRTGTWILEWDHVAHRFSLAATLADPALHGSAAARIA